MIEAIAAISTPLAVGGISVVRISGENAIEIASKVFCANSGEQLAQKKGYTASYGKVFADNTKTGTPLDDCIATVFREPKSYTGENIVELSCHGGIFNTKEVLRAVLNAGATLAQPGEFTKRAFLNGKLSLTQAEAVITLIDAKNRQAHNAARAQMEGALAKRLDKISEALTAIAGSIAAWIDYPEEDLFPIDDKELLKKLKDQQAELLSLLSSYDSGRLLREGVDTVIAGKPNVGKSTLMNLLSGRQKSIVTEIAGTTRDIVEETISLGEVTLCLSDTAGIRETLDVIEREGVGMAKKRIETADLVLCVFDGAAAFSKEDAQILQEVVGKPAIAVVNKSDMGKANDKLIEEIAKAGLPLLLISAKDGSGADLLAEQIKATVKLNGFDAGAGILQNERQLEAAKAAKGLLDEAATALFCGVTWDAIGVLVENALDKVLTLSGKKAAEEVVNNVFANFCVGK